MHVERRRIGARDSVIEPVGREGDTREVSVEAEAGAERSAIRAGILRALVCELHEKRLPLGAAKLAKNA